MLLDQPQVAGDCSPPVHVRPLKILHRALVLLRLSARLESAEIAAPSSFWIYFP
jgi:hypothetical protein